MQKDASTNQPTEEELLGVEEQFESEELLGMEEQLESEELLGMEKQLESEELLGMEEQLESEELLGMEEQLESEELLGMEEQLESEELLGMEEQLESEKLLGMEEQLQSEELLSMEEQLESEELLGMEEQLESEELLGMEELVDETENFTVEQLEAMDDLELTLEDNEPDDDENSPAIFEAMAELATTINEQVHDSDTTPISAAQLNDMTIRQVEELLIGAMNDLSNALTHSQSNEPDLEQSVSDINAPTKEEVNNSLIDPNKAYSTAIHHYKNEDYTKSAKWMRKSAMRGHVKAQFYMGIMFIKGNGLPVSIYHAYSWLALAASQGSTEASEAKQQIEKKLTAKEINSASRLAAERYETIHDYLFKN